MPGPNRRLLAGMATCRVAIHSPTVSVIPNSETAGCGLAVKASAESFCDEPLPPRARLIWFSTVELD